MGPIALSTGQHAFTFRVYCLRTLIQTESQLETNTDVLTLVTLFAALLFGLVRVKTSSLT
jgi:hypothetical protein